MTLAEAALKGVPWREVTALVAAPVAGGCLGTIVANLMFELPAVSVATAPEAETREPTRQTRRRDG